MSLKIIYDFSRLILIISNQYWQVITQIITIYLEQFLPISIPSLALELELVKNSQTFSDLNCGKFGF